MCVKHSFSSESNSKQNPCFFFDHFGVKEFCFTFVFYAYYDDVLCGDFEDFLQGGSSLPDSERLSGDSLPSLYGSTVSDSSFSSNAVQYSLIFMAVSV